MTEPRVFTYAEIDRVVTGEAFDTALAAELDKTGARRAFLLVGGTLSRETDTVDRIRAQLGDRLVGVCNRMSSHTPLDEVIAAAKDARAAAADVVVTVGGGSVTDGGKLILLCLGNDVDDMDELRRYNRLGDKEPAAPPMRQIAVPTTLSAGEFNRTAGGTDPIRHLKQTYHHPLLVPQTIILDPALTRHTPEWLWLSMSGNMAGVVKGASHGIGHMLGGTANVPHGYTSCVMLPHVLRYNKPVNADQQTLVSLAFGRPDAEAADAVSDLVAALGLPQRLRDVGVKREQFREIAENSMNDRCIPTNPRPINSPDDIIEILEMAW